MIHKPILQTPCLIMKGAVILIQSGQFFIVRGGTFMLRRHEINYWFSDALMGLKAVLHLVLSTHNLSIAITSALSMTSALFFTAVSVFKIPRIWPFI